MLSSAIFQEIKSLVQSECCQEDVSVPGEPPQAQGDMGQTGMLSHTVGQRVEGGINQPVCMPHIPQPGTGRYLINEKGQGFKCNARV